MATFLGGCNDHFKVSENHITHFGNTTKVADYRCEDDPDFNHSGIAFYSRPSNSPNPCSGDSPDCSCGHPKCGPWPLDERATNVYTEVGFDNLARCFKLGFKNVQAQKSWHGRYGYKSHDFGVGGISVPADPAGSSTCSSCGIECEQTASDGTKYCQIDVTAYSKIFSDESTVHRSFGVNKQSGIITIPGTCSDVFDTPTVHASAIALLSISSFGLQNIINVYLTTSGVTGTAVAETISDCGLTRDKTWISNDFSMSGAPVGTLIKEAHLNVGSGHVEIKVYDYLDDDHIPLLHKTTVDFTNTTLSYVGINYDLSDGSEVDRDELTSTLSDAYTAATVYSELVGLLGQIDMTDDKKYQWRTDAFTTIAPLVSYREKGPTAPSATIGDCSYVDPSIADSGYDGTIRGPLLDAGKHGFIDYDHMNFNACEDEGCIWFLESHGAKSGGGVEPDTATQWTDKQQASRMSPFAFISMTGTQGAWSASTVSPFSTGVLYAQKWAECRVMTHRFNSSRPCRADKSILDEQTTRCVTGVSGSTLTISSAPSSPYSIVGVSGVMGVTDGIYPVLGMLTTGGVTTVTLGSMIEARSFSDSDGIIGEIKYPSAGGCTGDFYLPPAGHYIYATWAHNFRDYQERDRVISQYASCASCASAAPDDSTPIRSHQETWGMRQSVSAFAVTQGTAGFSACAPFVFCIRPAGQEDWGTGGAMFDFPGSFAADGRYGSLWQGEIIQQISDPYWQTPRHCVSDLPVPILAVCPPVVEAQLSPTPPFGYLSLGDLDTGSPPDGNVLPPPDVVGESDDCIAESKATDGLPWTRLLAGCADTGKDAWTAP